MGDAEHHHAPFVCRCRINFIASMTEVSMSASFKRSPVWRDRRKWCGHY
ncbi:hypothetical protein OCAR_7556 [Afipia carboxidovorans OM5]|nr:hypothetical protein OCAR_7556 [Afipia carboxidovorans OM5]